ncbi:Site-specific recombinase XerD [Lactobacillus bombicola]|uniref:Site-specific recombinase XerD n=1 Tax=Lactobacillus bombicola TaxID=1505723 RepID=A0A1I1SPZ9_9LACO|nr:tyrosine-type recombinase/integrase [Lactobacillus bombicola]SFD48402.1 Site-specific recombinase XerD [Lactobacillus bombicola]
MLQMLSLFYLFLEERQVIKLFKKLKVGKHANEYLVRIQPTDKVTGKRINWPVKYADNRKNAIKLERQMWAEYESGLNPNDGKVVFADDFKRYVKLRSKSISKVTLKSWQETARSVNSYFGKARIDQISTAMVNKYAHDYVAKHKATVSRSSNIAKRLIHLRNYFKSLEGKVIKENPVPENALKVFFKQSDFTVSQEWRIFTTDELVKIRKLIVHDLKHNPVEMNGSKLAILIESYTGMRVGELQALKFSNIVRDEDVLTFRINDSWSDLTKSFNGSLKARPKGYTRTLLPIPQDVIDLVRIYQARQKQFLVDHDLCNPLDLVFMNIHDYKKASNQEPITQKSINEMLRKICQQLDINSNGQRMSLYSFRHTVCTQLANTPKMSYPWAADKMGHSLQMFMKTYVGLSEDINKKMNELWVG